jgi:A/G-specific adenine glycosylase
VTPALARSRAPLLRWYEPRRSAYPWRRTTDPYAILVSEVMLQQTQASRVAPAFERFLSAFPRVADLATAERADVVRAWDGLGYNRRAVSLWRAAREIVSRYAGRVPGDVERLRELPGVGPYTAAAVASIAFGATVAAIDTNVRRVVARVAADADPVDAAASAWLDPGDPGGWNQAVMDLGREVCRPLPRCDACPIAGWCASAGAIAHARRASRPGPPFEGSTRQARGAVVRALRSRPVLTLGRLSEAAVRDLASTAAVVASLERDGVVAAGPAARAARPNGRVRLA